jgi:hypothetical protein
MSEGLFLWRDIRLGEPPYMISKVTGWIGLPGGSYQSDAAADHGILPPAITQGPRIVTIEGFLRTAAGGRDGAIAGLQAAMDMPTATDTDTEPLTGTLAGVTATADAQIIEGSPDVDGHEWYYGAVDWRLQWLCPDPLKYGAWITSEQAALDVTFTPIALPQTIPFTLPDEPMGGQVSIFNPGTYRGGSPARIWLAGAQGGQVGVALDNGARLIYELTLAADRGDGQPDVLEIDTARGGAYLNGEYRPPTTNSDLVGAFRLPPGRTTNVRALGAAVGGSPYIQVAVRPAYS